MRYFLLLLATHAFCFAHGQFDPKSLGALAVENAPVIDGVLDEQEWALAPSAKDFVMETPHPGMPMAQPTEVKVLYDDHAIYLGFYNFDSAPDSILRQLSGRDQNGNTDYCGVMISCYRDGINGFVFYTSPNGEQYDARMDGNGDDVSWNAVWYSRCSIQPNGWFAEFKIPFAAIRFPNQKEQVWNINFVRDIRRVRQHGYWRGVNPALPGYLTQMGELTGIHDINPPKRIFLFPYASAYYDEQGNSDGTKSTGFAYNGGLDLKLGLSDAFTMDMTLIPDFGQTISDQQILNLSAFEVQFQDNRQFFTEGTELFNRAEIFYSRRVGFERPYRYHAAYDSLKSSESVQSIPSQDRILNAFKISGRNKNKTGIGFFNAITSGSEAQIFNAETGTTREFAISTPTNYNVAVIDQVLPNNSYVSLINTNVMRTGSDMDVNVTGVEFELRNAGNKYSIFGSGAVSNKSGEGLTPFQSSAATGFKQAVFLNKIDGNFTWSVGQYMESNTYDPNDLGFLQANNSRSWSGSFAYRIFKPFGRFNRMWSSLDWGYNRLYMPNNFTDVYLGADFGITTRRFNTFGFNVESMPTRGFDYFEPRVWGRFVRTYASVDAWGWYSSDYRKRIAVDIGAGYGRFENSGRFKFNWRVAPRIRFNDHLFLTYVYSYQSHHNDLGFAYGFEDDQATAPLFAKRDVVSHTNVLTVKYAFNPFMTANVRVRHYWGFTRFHEFYGLMDDGYFRPADEVSPAQSFNTYTVDLTYSWIFTPGSELRLMWKQGIYDYSNIVQSDLGEDLTYMWKRPRANSFSVKLIYFLDYQRLARKPVASGATF
ncbi:MAG: DUF5916 domain-containing protein [Flavobacteriales bacterium]